MTSPEAICSCLAASPGPAIKTVLGNFVAATAQYPEDANKLRAAVELERRTIYNLAG
jgi:hypothetical protein